MIAALLILSLFYFATDVILSLFAAVLMAIFFRGLGNWLSKYTKLPQKISVVLVALLIFGIFGFGFWMLEPKVTKELMDLRDYLPQAVESLRLRLANYGWGKLVLEQIPEWSVIFNTIISGTFLRRIGGFFSTTIGIAANFVIVVLVAIYLALEPHIYIDGFVKLFTFKRRDRVREILGAVGNTLRWWLVGKFSAMFLIGVLTWLGLMYLGVPLALTLGIIAALFTFIPNFGPILAVLPAALLALVESPTKSLYVLILYFIIQFIESYFVTPLIQQRAVSLPPVLTIIFQVLLGVLVGGLGLVLATPLLAAMLVTIKMLYVEDVLGDTVEVPDNKVERREQKSKEN